MGSPLAPLLSNVFMSKIELDFLNKFQDNIAFYKRYVDDTILLWKGDDASFQQFFNYINSIHPNIRFTCEWESEFTLNFLDISVSRNPGLGFNVDIFRKKMSTFKPLHWWSCHHPSQKLGLLTSSVLRARKLITCERKFLYELSWLREAFLQQKYPLHLIYSTMVKALKKPLFSFTFHSPLHHAVPSLFSQSPTFNVVPQSPKIPKIWVKVPFHTVLSKPFVQRWKKALNPYRSKISIKLAYIPGTNLKSSLISHSNPGPQKTTGVVYGVYCSKCSYPNNGLIYIGQTGQNLQSRLFTHFYNKAVPSAIRDHEKIHAKSNFNYKILKRVHDANEREIWESNFIRKLRPPLNENLGRALYCL